MLKKISFTPAVEDVVFWWSCAARMSCCAKNFCIAISCCRTFCSPEDQCVHSLQRNGEPFTDEDWTYHAEGVAQALIKTGSFFHGTEAGPTRKPAEIVDFFEFADDDEFPRLRRVEIIRLRDMVYSMLEGLKVKDDVRKASKREMLIKREIKDERSSVIKREMLIKDAESVSNWFKREIQMDAALECSFNFSYQRLEEGDHFRIIRSLTIMFSLQTKPMKNGKPPSLDDDVWQHLFVTIDKRGAKVDGAGPRSIRVRASTA